MWYVLSVEGNVSDKGRVLMMLTFASNIHPCYACEPSRAEVDQKLSDLPFSIVFDDGCRLYSHNLEKTCLGEARYKYTMKVNGRFEVVTWRGVRSLILAPLSLHGAEKGWTRISIVLAIGDRRAFCQHRTVLVRMWSVGP